MDINKILTSDYLDILFEGRNKKYGGYELRKNYPKRMRKAMFFIFGVLILIAASAVIASIKPAPVQKVAMTQEVTLAEPPPIDPNEPPPPPPPPPPPVKPTVKFTPPVIEKDEEVAEEEVPPEQEEMKEADAGLADIEGDPNALDPGIVDPGPGTGVVEQAPPKVFAYVEQMPEPGYDVYKYIADNTNYPPLAKESGITGRVAVKFVVNEDGSISGVEIAGKRRLGAGLEEEAMRVVRSFPKWKAGKQNGRPVKVYFTLPIKFILGD